MIIKFQADNSWIVFGEVDHLEYTPLVEEKHGTDERVLCYPPPLIPDKPAFDFYEVSFFTKNMTEATVIHAYSPIYLMNDNGKTIETI